MTTTVHAANTLSARRMAPVALAREPRISDPVPYVVCAAELAECTCPDECDRDHGND